MSRKTATATLAVILVTAFVLPFMDLSTVMAQIPPPELPGAPDQSPIWGAGVAAAAAVAFGIRQLARRKA